MIRLSVLTEMEFKTLDALQNYLYSPEMGRITGFRREIELALEKGSTVQVSTPRPTYGVVTRSEIKVEKFLKVK